VILRACIVCGALSANQRCATHAPAKRSSAARRGYDAQWRRTRARFLRAHPRCEHGGCTEPATEAHHLDGLGPNGPAGHDEFNLQALCGRHHSQVTAREQPGGWAR
jgi:5-methylcytosine-specific restriction protein A